METATMTSPTPSLPLSMIGETKVSDADIDVYATRVLETMSPPEISFIDDSLGPYVTSLLRCADIQDKRQVTTLAEFDSILELLEDQCCMDKKKASDCLILIADAVITHIIPFSEPATFMTSIDHNFGLYTQRAGGPNLFESIGSDVPDCTIEIASAATTTSLSKLIGKTDSSIQINAGGPSPLKPDNLIPIDLMGELDDPSPDHSSPRTSLFHKEQKHDNRAIIDSPQINIMQSTKDDDFPPLGASPEAFPPLRASVDRPQKSRVGSTKKVHGKFQQHSDKDLAAKLFRPARPRQNSLESEDATSRSRGSSNASASMTTTTNMIDEGSGVCDGRNNFYFEQQLNSCVEILLSMNQELSEEAASVAGLMANTDFNLAQYIIDSAMSAPPICRHMLQGGCYRSDCTFSHDVEGHTCLFWLRGRCGKGSACKFFHGFHEKLLKGIDTSVDDAEQQSCNRVPSPGYHQPYPLHHNSPPSTLASSTASASTLNSGFSGTFSPLISSSWQATPSLEAFSGGSVAYMPASPSESAPFSFANIASKGYEKNQFSDVVSSSALSIKRGQGSNQIPTVRIPQELWNPHENRDPSVFYIDDPVERYQKVTASIQRADVIDLHFQSIKTFPIVLEKILPSKLNKNEEDCHQVWIITRTGHHVGRKTHQRGGGTLESAVVAWLIDNNYNFSRGKDRNGLGGALLVKRP